MATGLKSRVIFREKTKEANEENYWEGTYKLLIKAKSIPSPINAPNMVDTSTLEDEVETQEAGRKQAGQMEISGAFEKKYKDELVALENKELDLVILYGTDGKGSEGMLAFLGKETFSPDDATDEHLTGTVSVSVNTQPRWIEDNYTVEVVNDAYGYPETITLTAKSA